MPDSSSPAQPSFDAPTRAMRMTFSYQGEEIRLVSRKTVSMRTPPSDSLDVPTNQAGFWFQVEDVNGRSLYRRVMHNPIRFDTETPSDDPERPLKRVPLGEARGTFFVLVPVLREADTVRILNSPSDPLRETEPARDVLSVKIIEDITGGGPEDPDKPCDQRRQ